MSRFDDAINDDDVINDDVNDVIPKHETVVIEAVDILPPPSLYLI